MKPVQTFRSLHLGLIKGHWPSNISNLTQMLIFYFLHTRTCIKITMSLKLPVNNECIRKTISEFLVYFSLDAIFMDYGDGLRRRLTVT